MIDDSASLRMGLEAANLIVTIWLFFSLRRSERSQAKDADLTAFRRDVDTRLDNQGNRLTRLESTAHAPARIDVESCCADFGERIASVEASSKGAPTHHDLARLHARIDDVAASVARIEGENAAQTRILNLIYESQMK